MKPASIVALFLLSGSIACSTPTESKPSQAGGTVLTGQFDQQTFAMVFAAFALGYVAALLIHRSSR